MDVLPGQVLEHERGQAQGGCAGEHDGGQQVERCGQGAQGKDEDEQHHEQDRQDHEDGVVGEVVGQVGAESCCAGGEDRGVVEAGVVHGLFGGVLDFVVALLAGGGEGVGVAGDLDAGQLAVLGEELVACQVEVGLLEGGGRQVEAAGLGGVGALVDGLEVVAGVVEAGAGVPRSW